MKEGSYIDDRTVSTKGVQVTSRLTGLEVVSVQVLVQAVRQKHLGVKCIFRDEMCRPRIL